MFKTSAHTTKVINALVLIANRIGSVQRDANNPHFGNEYVSLDSLTERIREEAKRENCTIIHSAEMTDGRLVVDTALLHDSGEWVSVSVPMPLSKQDPQGAGGGITYGRRYGLMSLFAVVGAEQDDDGNTASGLPERKPTAPASRPASRPTSGTGAKMPFGETKGQLLSTLDTNELTSALDWAVRKDKFKEFQVECNAELDRRMRGNVDRDLEDDGGL